ncbi:MAG: cupin domain-containing protein [Micromonosporaceae bacterium]
MTGDVVKLGSGQSLRIVSSSAEVLELESTWTAIGSKPPRHYHPRQDERFEVIDGQLTVEVNGERRVLRAGDALDVPRGAVHRMWNAGPDTARASWRVRPRLRTEEMFRFMDQGMSPLRIVLLLWRFRNEYRPGLRSRR